MNISALAVEEDLVNYGIITQNFLYSVLQLVKWLTGV
jgi:hypothetical protein